MGVTQCVTRSSSVSQIVSPASGSWKSVSQKVKHLCKYTTWTPMPLEYDKHNSMPLTAFFIAVQNGLVALLLRSLLQCVSITF